MDCDLESDRGFIVGFEVNVATVNTQDGRFVLFLLKVVVNETFDYARLPSFRVANDDNGD